MKDNCNRFFVTVLSAINSKEPGICNRWYVLLYLFVNDRIQRSNKRAEVKVDVKNNNKDKSQSSQQPQ